jgi:N-dimethylarginine dimethylaminohydrolase
MTCTNEFGRLRRVALLPAHLAFESEGRIARDWQALNFTAPPDPTRARAQYERFAALLESAGAQIDELQPTPDLTLDAIYVRDASITTPRGIVLARMGKAARRGEPAAQRLSFERLGVPVLGAIEGDGRLEGGDLVWLDDRTVAVGHGYRTNRAGIVQLQRWLGELVHVEVVGLPHYRGPDDVFHLMSIISPVDRDLAVVYSPLMPVPFRSWLLDRGIALVEVPDSEFESMGANVLAVGPRRVVMLDGNPITRARLESAGAEVWTYEGSEISVKGGGGPTCLTRPLEREQ